MPDPTRFEIELLAQALWAEHTRPRPTECRYNPAVHHHGAGGTGPGYYVMGGGGGGGGAYVPASTLWADQPLDTRIVWRRRAADMLQEAAR